MLSFFYFLFLCFISVWGIFSILKLFHFHIICNFSYFMNWRKSIIIILIFFIFLSLLVFFIFTFYFSLQYFLPSKLLHFRIIWNSKYSCQFAKEHYCHSYFFMLFVGTQDYLFIFPLQLFDLVAQFVFEFASLCNVCVITRTYSAIAAIILPGFTPSTDH